LDYEQGHQFGGEKTQRAWVVFTSSCLSNEAGDGDRERGKKRARYSLLVIGLEMSQYLAFWPDWLISLPLSTC
jgi:hypothetical protein